MSRSGVGKRIGDAAAERELLGPSRFRRPRQDRGAVGHQRAVGLAGAVPFEQGEFRMVQRAALAVAEDLGEFDDPALAGRQRASCRRIPARCANKAAKRRRRAPRASWRRRADASRFLARPASAPVSTSTNSCAGKPGAQRSDDAAARQERRPPVGVNARVPEGRGGRRGVRHILVRWEAEEIGGDRAQDRYGAPRPKAKTSRKPVKVIASSLRKGNIVESRRQARRHRLDREHPSRQGHAGDPDRRATDRRRREGLAAL